MSASGGGGKVLLAHGAGGRLTHELVASRFVPVLDNPFLRPLTDAAVLPELPPGRPALTTDGFVVSPPVFAGGDLGYLAVAGTVNDLAVSGAQPLWLAWALILEEGLPLEMLEVFVDGAARAAREAGVRRLALFHHAPDADEDTLRHVESLARNAFPASFLACEGGEVDLAVPVAPPAEDEEQKVAMRRAARRIMSKLKDNPSE